MRRFLTVLLALTLTLSLVACGSKGSWQEQYDLGVRYLSEGNYEEAVIAFTAAIEIDPKRPEGYSGLANTYIAMGDYDSAAGVWESISDENVGENTASFSMWQQKSEDIRTALENEESGIWIMDCVYDKARFASGDETAFEVVALYAAPNAVECSLYLAANTDAPHCWTSISDRTEGKPGIGICRLTGSAVPTQWKQYFALTTSMNVNVRSDDSDFYYDTIYITPEGELSEAYAPLNSYGGAEFSCRATYQTFEEYSSEDQQFISAFASVAITGDVETAKKLLGYEWESNGKNCTIWNGYKLEILSSGESLNDDGDRQVSADIWMRPENGQGYIFKVSCIDAVASLQEECWSNAVFVDRIVCPCTDWQWNGTMNYTSDFYHFYYSRDGETCNSLDHTVMNGNMALGLRDGTFSIEQHFTKKWSRSPSLDVDKNNSASAYYEQGILKFVSGNVEGVFSTGRDSIGREGELTGIEEIWYGGSLNDQRALDDLYW